MSFLRRFRKTTDEGLPPKTVVIVSGLPRSGTSMMMKVLEAAGLQLIIDGERKADSDNPEGYYEFERVKQMDKGDVSWVAEADGKAVKVISALLEWLPPGFQYRVIFMNRRMEEVLRSQRKMLEHRGEPSGVDDEKLAELMAKHVGKVKAWVAVQPNFTLLDLDYNQMLADPGPGIHQVNVLLGGHLDEQIMVRMVNPDLYRNRSA